VQPYDPFMITVAAVLVCLVLSALTVFQGLLVLGAPWGRFAWGGRHRVLPVSLRAGSVVSIVIYAVIAAVVLARAGLVLPDVTRGAVRTATWVVVAYFFLGIGLNLASRSRPERAVMSPVTAVLCAGCAVVALG
jgi:predicted permease